MKKNLNYRPHVLTVTRGTDKERIQKFLNLEKHPRQKPSYLSESVIPHLPLHLVL
jgi:hypothetical protein